MALPDDNILQNSTVGGGLVLERIYAQLKIITIILRQGLNVPDEDTTLLQQAQPTLIPPVTNSTTSI